MTGVISNEKRKVEETFKEKTAEPQGVNSKTKHPGPQA